MLPTLKTRDHQSLVTIKQTCGDLSLGKSKVFELIGMGKLKRVKIGRATRITTDSIAAYINSLVEASN